MDKKNLNLVHEVIDSPIKAEKIAEAQSSVSRYKYRASALVAGYPPLRPYDPIYLTGLPDGMSGAWVVISVTHQFNLELQYAMRLVLGSNDDLLALNVPKIKDLTSAVVEFTPEIVSEKDTLLTYRENKENDYVVERMVYSVIPGTFTEPIENNPVKKYIDSIDSSSFNINSFKQGSSIDVEKPNFFDAIGSVRWVRS